MPQTLGIWAPMGRDAAVLADILGRAGLDSVLCSDLDCLISGLSSAVGSAIIAEEALGHSETDRLASWLDEQPPWSDLPIILMTKRNGNVSRQMQLADRLGNVTMIERPFHPVTLVSTARAALRARKRQREAEAHIQKVAEGRLALLDERTRLEASQRSLKQANEKLGRRFSEALAEKRVLADIVELSDAFVQVADLNYRWLAINRAAADEFQRIFGKRPEVGKSMLDLLDDMPEHRRSVQAVWGRALAGEEFTEVSEFGNQSLDQRCYEMRFSPLLDAKGERIGAYQFVYDVTDRLQEQQQLAEAQARMHEMAKLETLGQLTGGVAHDFNNLLTPIIGTLDYLQRKSSGDPRTSRLITGALESAERSAVLVQRLLTFARRQHLEARPVDIGQLVEGMSDLIQRSIGPHVPVHLETENDLPAAKIDPNQLELAILNLAVNAKDAMAGGGSLSIKVRHQHNSEGATDLKPGDYVCLSVTDVGSGMDAATLSRAIEPFYTTKGPGKGTGLGLSMVHGLAAQSGGGLKIHSTPGIGTTAEIWLPATTTAADAIRKQEDFISPQPHHSVILLVDDEDIVRGATADMLRELGHEVVEASSGTAALQVLQSRPEIEILISDHIMPGLQGRDLIRKAILERPDLKALLVTGYAQPEEAQEDGALRRLSKPFRAADLARELAQLLTDDNVVELSSYRK